MTDVDLRALMDGYLATQLLHAAARLGVADALAGGPRTAADLAAELDADPGALRRLLRGLAAHGVFEERDDGRFALTPAGAALREGTPGSLRSAAIARGWLYYDAAERLIDTVRTGRTAFEIAHGAPFFDHIATRPDKTAAFQDSMANRGAHEAADVVAAYDFGRFRRLVDVGGGRGVMLAAVLAATPGLAGVLFDRPEVVERARAGLPPGCEAVGGDFFRSVPGGADAYLLARVIHDWDDDDALRILTACRDAMPEHATLLLAEAVLPERAIDDPAAIRMDVSMLALFPGRERTVAEYASLLAAAGFALRRVVPTASSVGVHVLEATLTRSSPSWRCRHGRRAG